MLFNNQITPVHIRTIALLRRVARRWRQTAIEKKKAQVMAEQLTTGLTQSIAISDHRENSTIQVHAPFLLFIHKKG